jgi:hypothetical protein
VISQFDQILNLAFSTSFAVLHISGNLDRTIEILDAVWQEEKQPVGAGPVLVRPDEMVIQLDE